MGGDSAPRVEMRTVQVFLALAEELHFARTAERVGLTPSRVSQVIRELEDHLGGALFVRTSRRVALTALGRRLCDRLRPHYLGIDEALAGARDESTGIAGEVLVGSYLLFNFGAGFTGAVREFEAAHPRATVRQIDIGTRRNPLDVLRDREVDALAMRLPVSDPDVVVGPVLTVHERVLVVAADHPLAGRGSVSYEDVADYAVNDMPQMPREMLDAFAPPRTASGRTVPRVQALTFFEVVSMVATGRIVHPTVAPFVDHVGHPGIVSVPFRDLPPSRTALMWLADQPPPAVLELARIVERRAAADPGPIA